MVDFTGGTWRSLIDGSEVGVIPDSGLLHDYDVDVLGLSDGQLVDTWTDDSGGEDGDGENLVYREGVLDGIDAVEFDQSNSHLFFDFDPDQPVAVFIWNRLDFDPVGNGENVRIGSDSNENFFRYVDSGDTDIRIADSNASGGSFSDVESGNGDVTSLIYESDNNALRIGGTDQVTQTGTSSPGAALPDRFTIGGAEGAGSGNDERFGGVIPRILVYDLNDLRQDSSISEVESAMQSIYG